MQVKNRYALGGGFADTSIAGKKNYGGTSCSRGSSTGRKSGKITVRRNISASSYMMRVAQARTPSQVSAVIRTAQADLQFVRSCNSDSEQVEKAKRIINRVISKSRLKISRLKGEQELEQQQKLAQNAEKKKIIRELKRKRRARRAQEAADTCDMERASVARVQEDDALSAQEIAALNGDTAALVSLSGAEGVTEVAAEASAAGAESCGGAVDVTV